MLEDWISSQLVVLYMYHYNPISLSYGSSLKYSPTKLHPLGAYSSLVTISYACSLHLHYHIPTIFSHFGLLIGMVVLELDLSCTPTPLLGQKA